MNDKNVLLLFFFFLKKKVRSGAFKIPREWSKRKKNDVCKIFYLTRKEKSTEK